MLLIEGRVKRGHQRGRRIGFRTINIPAPARSRKKDWGIYCSLVTIAGRVYPGVTHLGPAPMFRLRRPRCETHLLTIRHDVYGAKVKVRLLFKLREVEQFPTVRQLIKQIKHDVARAKQYFDL